MQAGLRGLQRGLTVSCRCLSTATTPRFPSPVLVAAAAQLDAPYKAPKRGEDACFVLPAAGRAEFGAVDNLSNNNDPRRLVTRAFGVFDGVGGWSLHGVDSGLFSRALAQHCADVVHQRALAAVERSGGDDPCTARGVSFVDALHEAVGMTSHKGTSTAVLVGLDAADDCTPQRTTQAPVEDDGAPTSRLVVANLGDSGAVVVRRAPAGEGDVEPLGGGGMVWKPLLRTKEQVHGWNTPLQVGTSGDDPRKADVWCVDGVRHGDIVLACSDGVFDNIWLRDLLLYIGGRGSALHALATDSPDDPAALETVEAEMRALALAVASSASKIGTNPKADTPFGGGGKEDDATVVAGMVRTH